MITLALAGPSAMMAEERSEHSSARVLESAGASVHL